MPPDSDDLRERTVFSTSAEASNEGSRESLVSGPLYPDAYAVVRPRGGMPGPYRCGCNSSYGQSCSSCDGFWIR